MKKQIRFAFQFFFVTLLLFLVPLTVLAVPPFNSENKPAGPTCFLNKKAAQQNAVRNLSRAPKELAFPTPANPAIFVIRVDFSNAAMTHTKAETNVFFDNVQSFYRENSYAAFIPTFTVSSVVYRLGTLAAYGADCSGDVTCHDTALRVAASSAALAAGVSFSSYDHLMIYHAGSGQETSNSANDIWSVYLGDIFSLSGKSFPGYTIVPEKEAVGVDALGVICHEYGHQLGLPDLYDTSVNGGRSTVGSWDLMDFPYTGASGGSLGANPPHMGAWDKTFLGFLSPRDVLASGNQTQLSVDVSSVVYRLPILVSGVGASNEYFLVEYRNKTSTATYDKGIPASGILIWHIDETIASNAALLDQNVINAPSENGHGHRGIDLVEADQTESYVGGSHGQAGDAFTTGSNFLTPQADAYNGLATGFLMTSFSGADTTQMQYTFEAPAVSSISASSTLVVSTGLSVLNAAITFSFRPGTFPNGTSIFYSALSSATFGSIGSGSSLGQLQETGVGFFLGAESGQEPAGYIPIAIDFSASPPLLALTALDKSQLTLARYVSAQSAWVPIVTTVEAANNRLTANLDHLSLFQVMKAQPSGSLADVSIYPNPLQPSRGVGYSSMHFSNLAANSTVKLYTLTGNLVVSLDANASGIALWDGRNQSGENAASGVYLALISDSNGGTKKMFRVAIQR